MDRNRDYLTIDEMRQFFDWRYFLSDVRQPSSPASSPISGATSSTWLWPCGAACAFANVSEANHRNRGVKRKWDRTTQRVGLKEVAKHHVKHGGIRAAPNISYLGRIPEYVAGGLEANTLFSVLLLPLHQPLRRRLPLPVREQEKGQP